MVITGSCPCLSALNDSSLPKLKSTPCWSTRGTANSPGCLAVTRIWLWFRSDGHTSCSLSVGRTWHWAQHSCLSVLQNGAEDGLNSISPLRRGPQLWRALAGHQPSTPEDRKKQTSCAAHFSCCWGWTCPCTETLSQALCLQHGTRFVPWQPLIKPFFFHSLHQAGLLWMLINNLALLGWLGTILALSRLSGKMFPARLKEDLEDLSIALIAGASHWAFDSHV